MTRPGARAKGFAAAARRASTRHVALCALLCAASASARAQEAAPGLDDVRAAYQELDYARCAASAQESLSRPAGRQDRVDALRYLGLCSAALGEVDAARDAFTRMLVVDRNAELPQGLSPRFTSAFREAKGALLEVEPTGFSVESDEVSGRVRVLRVRLVDPTGIVAKVSTRGASGLATPPVRAAPRLELEVPSEGDVEVLGLDRAGGEVTVLRLPPPRSAQDAIAAAAPPAAASAEDEAADGPWLWAGAAAGAAVLVGGAAAAAVAFALAPPSRVGFTSDVVFGDPDG